MHVEPEQLLLQLREKPWPLVWVAGDEPLLVQEACDDVREFARKNAFAERETFDAGTDFDWTLLLASANSISLFGEKKLLDLRLHSPTVNDRGKKSLQAYVDQPGDDNLLLITSGKLEKAKTAAKWFKAIEHKALFVQIWPVRPQQFPRWIAQRLQRKGLQADRESIQILCQRVEGNLLAAVQEIDKLSILLDDKRLTADRVMYAVSDNARFNVFVLTDLCLAGNGGKAMRILHHLKSEGEEPLKILHFLTRETRALLRMREKIQRGGNINAAMQAERVWQSRREVVRRALSNHTVRSLEAILNDARVADQAAKGLLDKEPWDELGTLVLKIANVKTCLETA